MAPGAPISEGPDCMRRELSVVRDLVDGGVIAPDQRKCFFREAYQPKGLWLRLDESSGADHALKVTKAECERPAQGRCGRAQKLLEAGRSGAR